MKDDTLPPILKIKSSILGSTLGATLATKRSSAEHGANSDELVIEPYANPFRLYPLRNDYNKFKDLFENTGVDCYVLNTGYFMDKKVTPKMTLGLIEKIVGNEINFKQFDKLKEIEFVNIDGFNPDFDNIEYKKLFLKRFKTRVDYIDNLHGKNKLPDEALKSISSIIDRIK